MSFGDRKIDDAYDRWATQTPEDAGYFEEEEEERNNICVLCGREFVGYGNNPAPLSEGVCCDECNLKRVIPKRIKDKGEH